MITIFIILKIKIIDSVILVPFNQRDITRMLQVFFPIYPYSIFKSI